MGMMSPSSQQPEDASLAGEVLAALEELKLRLLDGAPFICWATTSLPRLPRKIEFVVVEDCGRQEVVQVLPTGTAGDMRGLAFSKPRMGAVSSRAKEFAPVACAYCSRRQGHKRFLRDENGGPAPELSLGVRYTGVASPG